MTKRQSTWTIIGLGNSAGDIIETIAALGGQVTAALFNQEVADHLLSTLPPATKVSVLDSFKPQTDYYCFGFVDPNKVALLDKLAPYNLSFPNVIHPSAVVSPSAQLGQGNYISAGVVIGAGAILGSFNYLNRMCSVGHDATLSDYNHLGPGAVVSGRCGIGSACFFGANATLIDGLSVTDEVILGAGSTAIRDLKVAGTYVGSPAQRLER